MLYIIQKEMLENYTMTRVTIYNKTNNTILDLWPSEFIYYGRFGFHCSFGWGRRSSVTTFSSLIDELIEYAKKVNKEDGTNELVVMSSDKLEHYSLNKIELDNVVNIIKKESELFNFVLRDGL